MPRPTEQFRTITEIFVDQILEESTQAENYAPIIAAFEAEHVVMNRDDYEMDLRAIARHQREQETEIDRLRSEIDLLVGLGGDA